MEPPRRRGHRARPPCRRPLLAAALLSLAAAAVWGESPPQAAPGPAASLPALQPLPAALAARMAELTRETARWRGLDFRRPVTSGELGTGELRRWIEATLAEELPPARLAGLEAALEAFGFIRPELDLARFLPDLLTEQIGGFYDSEREVLVLVRNAAARAAGAEAAGDEPGDSPGPPDHKLDEAVLVHELTHALQDQVFALPESNDPGFFFDRESARDALVEGDATLTMLDYMMGARLEERPGLGAILGGLGQLAAGGVSGIPADGKMGAAPPYFRETLLFSYFQGLDFCAEVRRAGGQRLLDHAFAQDPPRSTEQILHPEKWHGRRDDPIAIALPDLAGELPGWSRLAEGELGEMGIGILLRGAPGAQSPGGWAASSAAAAGWGGDRFVAYGQGGRRLLLWITEWDAPAEAEEFAGVAGRLGAGWTLERQAPTRVSLIRGELPAGARKALLARLATALAGRPLSRDIDFRALGIERRPDTLGSERRPDTPEPPPAPGTPPERQ